MKFSKLKKLAGVFFALVLGTSVAFSQGKQNRYMGNNNVQERFNINQLNDLSEQQKKAITELNEKHMTKMAELREKRQSEYDPASKTGIRDEMLESILAHRNSIKQILKPEQQKQFDLLILKKDLLFAGIPRMNKGMGNRQGWRNNTTRECYCFNGNRCQGCQGRCKNGFGRTQ